MEITLEKIDQIMDRADVGYAEAKEALVNSNGDVIEALIYLEKKNKKVFKNLNLNEKGNELIERLREALKKGNITRVIIEREGDIILNLPVSVGAIGLVMAPVASIIGVSAAMVTNYRIKIVKDDGETIDLNEITEEKLSEVREKINFKKNKEGKDITEEVIKEVKEENGHLDK
ncbi:protein of unknown function [Alkalithermobacter thermoalcaliphilus JW-YL-7 = DSM 7308]|uniref:DUF4342 domain-containing protein n=1 Tax=Alkalithermobacter thermoalcaliphilus JW-YL-7 = DSM 7308 TaxID=1121328 RepID=A0A150FPY1_CLOPD|nr:protein of unknown function DUF4342 [[Clostridium] paradoxum JW-YL-7 = DSM 7308]SHK64516.1 protein of unknown function [[Clostridium] paradoxum JW-YL-7 = DSM 7308]